MAFHTLWPTHIQIEDNVLPDIEFAKLKNFMFEEFKRQKKFPMINFDHDRLPTEVDLFRRFLLSAFTNYCQNAGEDSSQFEIIHFQVHQVLHYGETMADEYITHTHHDQAEGGYFAITFYLNIDEPKDDRYLGGELAVYKNSTATDYPNGIVYVKPKENRLAIFPAFLSHVVRPYFGDQPRMTIAVLMTKARHFHQNKKIRILD
tara:strand:+ start:52372 stop:52983 length:612 start_codon:yes stop_codon:yes gene_type:complete